MVGRIVGISLYGSGPTRPGAQLNRRIFFASLRLNLASFCKSTVSFLPVPGAEPKSSSGSPAAGRLVEAHAGTFATTALRRLFKDTVLSCLQILPRAYMSPSNRKTAFKLKRPDKLNLNTRISSSHHPAKIGPSNGLSRALAAGRAQDPSGGRGDRNAWAFRRRATFALTVRAAGENAARKVAPHHEPPSSPCLTSAATSGRLFGRETPKREPAGLRCYRPSRCARPRCRPPRRRKYWTRRSLANGWSGTSRRHSDAGRDRPWLFVPLRYFECMVSSPTGRLSRRFQKHWPTDEDNTYVDFVRTVQRARRGRAWAHARCDG